MRDDDRIWTLMARKLAGEASEDEIRELQELLEEKPDIANAMGILHGIWGKSSEQPAEAADKAAVKQLLAKARQQPVADVYPGTKKEEQGYLGKHLYKNESSFHNTGSGKFSSYFKTGIRSLRRNKSFSIINIAGLTIGMAAAILLLLWIQYNVSFDQFHKNKDRVYQLYNQALINGKKETWETTPMVMGPVIKSSFPQVEEMARINWVGAFVLSAGERHLQAQGYLTDSGFFKIFSFPLIKGDEATALRSPHSIVLTEKMARKLFDREEAMGKTISIDSITDFKVTGIIQDQPPNTQFNFEYLVPWSYTKEVGWENLSWGTNSIRTFVLLKQGVSEQQANGLIRNITRTHAPGVYNEIFVHPMRKWWLWSRFENGKIVGGGIEDVRLFGVLAGLILLIACINYMNLSTARSMKRAKEVGIRKLAGAARKSLIQQFILESVIISFIAGILALLLAQEFLPFFNSLTGQKLTIPYDSFSFWLYAAGFILFTGLMAGSYPAFYLSSFKPVAVLKGSFKTVHTLFTPRKILVVIQFGFAVVLIICTIVIYRQIDYGQKRNNGFNRDNLVYIYNKGSVQEKYELIKDQLLKSGAVVTLTRTNSPITDVWSWEDSYEWKGKVSGSRYLFARFNTDGGLTQTMGMTLLAGRDINTTKFPSDSTALLLNESAVKLMHFENPVGVEIKTPESNWHVVGVIKDFVPGRPYDPIYPTVVQGPGHGNWFGTLTLKLNGRNFSADNLEKISGIFKKYNPAYPFQYYWVNDAWSAKFQGEQHIGTLSALFTGLTILISCLGLFALAACMTENRIKEIGVRKVLGASVTRITTLLSKDFLQPVILSFILASPLAWWAMHSWLQQYAYRVDISWWIFAVAGFLAVLIALVTVSSQAVKAAMISPVKSLRKE